MASNPRSRSESGCYHVTARGVGKHIVFEDDDDRITFGTLLRKYLDKYDGDLFAWCFMQNHIHLLPCFKSGELPSFMRDLLSVYANHFNSKHGHVGHVFQGRFHSVPIDGDAQFLAVIRYIHQNPKDMGFDNPSDYKWSSYGEYTGSPFITNTNRAIEILGGVEPFISFHRICDDSLIEAPIVRKQRPFLPDDEAIELAKSLTSFIELSEIASCNKSERDAHLALLKANGFSIPQIARLTGIGRNIIQRAK